MRFKNLAIVLCLLSLPAIVLAQKPRQQYAPEIGKRHFDFALPNIADGKPVYLSGLRGKKVLLIHFASW